MTEKVRQLIIARMRERVAREKTQGELLDKTDDYAETIFVKLSGRLEEKHLVNFGRCGHEQMTRTCRACGKWENYFYRCNLKWCPRCQQRLALIRKNLIETWTSKIQQPKHLVLTHKNFPVLTKRTIQIHTKRLATFRRSKCFREVTGGCCSTEITHGDNQWHLHAHMLIDVRWLDMEQVSIRWGKICGQQFAIVKIKDVRQRDYLKEVCKYVVEPGELAGWAAEHVNEFVRAVQGNRMFSSFGSLRKLAPQIREEIKAAKGDGPACECGSSDFLYESELAVIEAAADNQHGDNSCEAPTRETLQSRARDAYGDADTHPSLL